VWISAPLLSSGQAVHYLEQQTNKPCTIFTDGDEVCHAPNPQIADFRGKICAVWYSGKKPIWLYVDGDNSVG